jgi:hypothetical protein
MLCATRGRASVYGEFGFSAIIAFAIPVTGDIGYLANGLMFIHGILKTD